MEWSPDAAVVHGHIDDVWLSIHILSSLSQKTHSNLHTSSTFQCNNYITGVSLSRACDGLSSVTVNLISRRHCRRQCHHHHHHHIIIIRIQHYHSVVSQKKTTRALNSEKTCQCHAIRHYSKMHIETAVFSRCLK